MRRHDDEDVLDVLDRDLEAARADLARRVGRAEAIAALREEAVVVAADGGRPVTLADIERRFAERDGELGRATYRAHVERIAEGE